MNIAVRRYREQDAEAWDRLTFKSWVSNEQEGKILNERLHRFKTSFGAGGVVHEFYEVELERGHDLVY